MRRRVMVVLLSIAGLLTLFPAQATASSALCARVSDVPDAMLQPVADAVGRVCVPLPL